MEISESYSPFPCATAKAIGGTRLERGWVASSASLRRPKGEVRGGIEHITILIRQHR